jgi:threonine/homoserine/homoserine lactone efflux protein
MLEPTNLMLFITASWALIVAPGPDLLYVLTRGLTQGRLAGLLSALGVCSGILVHTFAAAFGLAALLQTSALAFMVVKYVGAAYLVYLGIKALRDKSGLSAPREGKPMSFQKVLWQGFLSNVFNPKVALFFLAFLPQFVMPGEGAAVQMLMLGGLFVVMTLAFTSLVGFFAGGLGRWLAGRRGVANTLRWLTGGVFIGLGVRLAFTERR